VPQPPADLPFDVEIAWRRPDVLMDNAGAASGFVCRDSKKSQFAGILAALSGAFD
jgi:hypothetical protein